MKILLLIALLVAVPALGWDSSPDQSIHTTRINTTSGGSVPPGSARFWDFNTTTDSGYLDVSMCGSISWYFDPDENGTATGATVLLRESTEPHSTCAAGAPATILTCDQNGDGTLTAADEAAWTGAVGLRGCRNVKPSASVVCVDVQANGTPDGARVQITCNP